MFDFTYEHTNDNGVTAYYVNVTVHNREVSNVEITVASGDNDVDALIAHKCVELANQKFNKLFEMC